MNLPMNSTEGVEGVELFVLVHIRLRKVEVFFDSREIMPSLWDA